MYIFGVFGKKGIREFLYEKVFVLKIKFIFADLEIIFLYLFHCLYNIYKQREKLYKKESETNPYNRFITCSYNNNNQIVKIKGLLTTKRRQRNTCY